MKGILIKMARLGSTPRVLLRATHSGRRALRVRVVAVGEADEFWIINYTFCPKKIDI